jgi:multidrug efflux pump
MIGVTLFGIFLTPVFFYVIDLLGETRLCTSRLVRRLETVSLDVLTLRPLWRADGPLRKRPLPPMRQLPHQGEPVEKK